MSHHLELVLERCAKKNLTLNWKKCHFMVQLGIVLGHEILKKEIEVDKAKTKVIAKLPTPKCVKDIHSFLGHAGFYRRFIKKFSKITRLLTNLLAKDMPSLSIMDVLMLGRSLRESLFLHQSYLH